MINLGDGLNLDDQGFSPVLAMEGLPFDDGDWSGETAGIRAVGLTHAQDKTQHWLHSGLLHTGHPVFVDPLSSTEDYSTFFFWLL